MGVGATQSPASEVAELLGVSPDAVDPDADLIASGLDSIRMMSLSGRWRKQGIDINFAALAENPTVAAWSALVAAQSGDDGAAGNRRPVDDGADARPRPFPLDADAARDVAGPQRRSATRRCGRPPLRGVRRRRSGSSPAARRGGETGCPPSDVACRDPARRHPADRRPRALPVAVYDLRELDAEAAEQRLEEIRRAEVASAARRRCARAEPVAAPGRAYPAARRHGHGRRRRGQLPQIHGRPRGVLPRRGPARTATTPTASTARRYGRLGSGAVRRGPPVVGRADPRPTRTACAAAGSARRTGRPPPQRPAVAHLRRRDAGRAFRGRAPPRRHAGDGRRCVVLQRAGPVVERFAIPAEPADVRAGAVPSRCREAGRLLHLVADARHRLRAGRHTPRSGHAAVQETLHDTARHSSYSGLSVLRDLGRHRGSQTLAPIVYTSALGLGDLFAGEVTDQFGAPVWTISQGPQVLIDAQATPLATGPDDQLGRPGRRVPPGRRRRDVRLPPRGVGPARHRRCGVGRCPTRPRCRKAQRAVRETVNNATAPPSGEALHDGFFRNALADARRTCGLQPTMAT